MANRIILGNRYGTKGLYISKPGYDALNGLTEEQWLLRTDIDYAQVMQSGTISLDGGFNYPSVYCPDLGYRPTIEYVVRGWYMIVGRWWSNTHFQFFPASDGNVYSPGMRGDPYNAFGPAGPGSRQILYRIWTCYDQ